MAKLNWETIEKELEEKDFTLINMDDYQNIKSPLLIKCKNNHTIKTSLFDLRKPLFECPECIKQINTIGKIIKPTQVPNKEKCFRIIGLDQATEKTGISIFDNGKLVYYTLLTLYGNLEERLLKFKNYLEDTIIKKWQPNFILFEDIQYQNNPMVFKILAMLQGICLIVCEDNNIDCGFILSKSWRSGLNIGGSARQEEKQLSKQKVKEWFGISTANEDTCEAILIGYYASKKLKDKWQ